MSLFLRCRNLHAFEVVSVADLTVKVQFSARSSWSRSGPRWSEKELIPIGAPTWGWPAPLGTWKILKNRQSRIPAKSISTLLIVIGGLLRKQWQQLHGEPRGALFNLFISQARPCCAWTLWCHVPAVTQIAKPSRKLDGWIGHATHSGNWH